MRKPLCVVAGLLVLAGAARPGCAADSTRDFSVQASAVVQASPAQITLSWPEGTCAANSYTVYRKAPCAPSWGKGIALPATATTYSDNHVAVGTPYEYQIV